MQYDQHNWKICCDLKVVQILMGLRQGYCKNQCFLCEWEGRRYALHYMDHEWKRRTSYEVGQLCIDEKPLVPVSVILLPPLHIKLGLVKNFIKAMVKKKKRDAKNGDFNDTMEFLATVFPKLSAAKLDEGWY